MSGKVVKVSGPLVVATGLADANMSDVVRVGPQRLIGEILTMKGDTANIQVYEETSGLGPGAEVETTGAPMSVELGPGMIEGIYDGIQRPLEKIVEKVGACITRGVEVPAVDHEKKWEFNAVAKVGDQVVGGDILGTVQETAVVLHKIMVPPTMRGTITSIQSGSFNVTETVATLKTEDGREVPLTMLQKWPVRVGRPYKHKYPPTIPLQSGQRIVDTFFPVAKGGTAAIPGPFGSGKTVMQHALAKWSDVDMVVYIGCGERGNEMTDVLREFPELVDPRTGRSLMERTIIICNTSSMPVAAREASVYTAVTMAEYYRQMGLDVLLLADSTSRWAQAMREMSGRLEEIPGEEAFPAYLESVIASFYERAGKVRLKNGKIASVTIGGTVSPAGGNFEEPVTQATLKVVGAFHGLSRERSDARKYPAIHPIDSWSKYRGVVDMERVEQARSILKRSNEINQMMKVIGEEGTSAEDYILYQKGELLDAVYLQQNSFDPIDAACDPDRQIHEFNVLYDVLTRDFALSDKKEIRAFFNQVRQEFLDWHNTVFRTPEFEAQEKRLKDFYLSKAAG